MFNVNKIRADFPILSKQNSLIYFDNASTTQKPKAVIEKITEFYSSYNSNVFLSTYLSDILSPHFLSKIFAPG